MLLKQNKANLRKRKLTPAHLPESAGFTGRELRWLKAPCPCSSSAPTSGSWGTGCQGNQALLACVQRNLASHKSFCDFLPHFHAVAWLLSLPFCGIEHKMSCKEESACHFAWGWVFSLSKALSLLKKLPSDKYLCLRRLRNFCLSEMMSSVYPQPLHSNSNRNQIPSCYPAFSRALTWQCHPLQGGEVI